MRYCSVLTFSEMLLLFSCWKISRICGLFALRGNEEDIELTLESGRKILAQAKLLRKQF